MLDDRPPADAEPMPPPADVNSGRLNPPAVIATPRFIIPFAQSPRHDPASDRDKTSPMPELRRSVEGGIQALMKEAQAKADPDDSSLTAKSPDEEEDEIDAPEIDPALDPQIPVGPATDPPAPTGARLLITEVQKAVPGRPKGEVPVLPLTPPDLEPPIAFGQTVDSEPEQRYSDEALLAALTAFQQSRTVPPLAMQIPLVTFAHCLVSEAIEAEDYERAESIEAALRDLGPAFQQCESDNATLLQSQCLESRLEEVKQRERACDIEWESRLAEFRERCAHKRDRLEQRHAAERREFEARCQAPDFLLRFTKPSSQLLAAWRMQKKLALQHDFDAAKQLKARCDEMQRAETAEAERRAMRSVQQNYEQLLARQKREVECAAANDARKLKQMEAERRREKEAVEKLNRQVETRLRDRRPPLKRSGAPQNSREITSHLVKRQARIKSGLGEASVGGQLDVKISDIKAVLVGKPK
jgi:hypothetical protein